VHIGARHRLTGWCRGRNVEEEGQDDLLDDGSVRDSSEGLEANLFAVDSRGGEPLLLEGGDRVFRVALNGSPINGGTEIGGNRGLSGVSSEVGPPLEGSLDCPTEC